MIKLLLEWYFTLFLVKITTYGKIQTIVLLLLFNFLSVLFFAFMKHLLKDHVNNCKLQNVNNPAQHRQGCGHEGPPWAAASEEDWRVNRKKKERRVSQLPSGQAGPWETWRGWREGGWSPSRAARSSSTSRGSEPLSSCYLSPGWSPFLSEMFEVFNRLCLFKYKETSKLSEICSTHLMVAIYAFFHR